MNCPECGKPLQINFRCTYNNVQMCIRCAYQQMPAGNPGRAQIEKNYPEVTNNGPNR
mgnify:CR=1 FL=1|jgi:hypothetical protein